MDNLKVVAIGGGTGLPIILEAMKNHTDNITAIVTVTDTGRSSGLLRKELNILPPGDIRNCLISLSNSEKLLCDLFKYRFKSGKLNGHNFGNLFIAALTKITGSFEKAIKETSKILELKGKVLPSTLDDAHICAELEDGRIVVGEVNILKTDKAPIKKVYLDAESVKPLPEAINAIKEADIIIFGPGSLFTSIITNLLIKDLARAVRKSKAKKIYICNIATQPGQTDNFKASDHVRRIIQYLGPNVLDLVILNNKMPKKDILLRYEKEGSFLVENDIDEIEKLGPRVLVDSLIYDDKRDDVWNRQDYLRHHPDKLARVVLKAIA